MSRLGCCALLAVVVAGCVSTDDQRLQDYNDDGIRLFQRGAYGEARETFQAALALKPADANLLYNLGECYDHLGQNDKAEDAYRECLRQAPGRPECMHALTALLVREHKRGDADALVQQWVRGDPRSAAAYAEFGWLCVQDKDYPRALASCQHAYELDPNDVHALNQLGRVYEIMNRKDRALALYERSLTYQPNQTEVGALVSRLKAEGAHEPHPD